MGAQPLVGISIEAMGKAPVVIQAGFCLSGLRGRVPGGQHDVWRIRRVRSGSWSLSICFEASIM